MDRAEEAELVARLRKGDKAALRVVYASFSDRLFGFLLRLARRRDVAEDLHQETWVSVARHAERLADGTDLAAWLFTIARNKFRSWRRWAALDFTRLAFDAEGPEPEGPSLRPDAGDELVALEKALEALPMAHREVLLLVGVEGLESKQAAEVLGIQPEAFRQRLSRARAALSEKLEGSARKDAAVVG
ncbi:RNA polymerase sigma factor [Polyangium sp. y55x31]|uniref:RNA polymerase sigma factor n=1 Tax=Polyangium sp. y55x31 TaxID=3042688 RepID=UPI002482D052|nr:RNA polymerase sigma factor [Polyangium sp. y55x31]MDI1480827.1 RNA polymerase sigma factor [Polyangium sp. y55x31]